MADLTDRKIKAARPETKPYRLNDGDGLSLEVAPSGGKRWRLRFTRPSGKRAQMSLGLYPAVSLRQARDRAFEARQCIAIGIDPTEQRREAQLKERGTFATLASDLMAKSGNLASSTTKKRQIWLNKYLLPAFGHRQLSEITATELRGFVTPIANAGQQETARRLLQFCSAIFEHAIGNAIVEHNPAQRLKPSAVFGPARTKSHAAITDPTELGELLRAIDTYQGHYTTAYALKIAPYVFVRPGELRRAEWSEVDLNAKGGALWTIPAAKMKMRRDHLIPLASQVVVLIRELQPVTGHGRYLFPSLRTNDRPMSNNTLNAAMRRLGYDGDTHTAHGFRSTASTLLHGQGVSSDLIEKQLAHEDYNATRAIYNRADMLPERRVMMQDWANYIEGMK